MSELDPQQFEDPALKKAVRAAMGNETAPPALRQRFAENLQHQRTPRFGPRLWALAAAAMVLIGIGAAYYYLREQTAPQWFADAMVTAHDQRVASPDHHLATDLPTTDPSQLHEQLDQKLAFPVLATLIGDGWQLRSAGLADFKQNPAAQLFFTRGDQTLSVFSVPSKVLYLDNPRDGTKYAQIAQNHEIAGFIQGRGIYCVVAYDPKGAISLDQTIAIRDQLHSAVKQ